MTEDCCSFEPPSNLAMVGEMINKCSDTCVGACVCSNTARINAPDCNCSGTCLQCTDQEPPPDHSLETWMHELQERNILARRIMARTGKSACQVLFNRASTVDQRDKSMVQRMLDHAERMRPVNRYIPKGFVLLECVGGRRVPNLLETVPRRKLHMEISGLPGLTKGEMLGKNWCCRRSAWINSRVVQEGILRREEDIKRVVPFFPDIEHLHVVGKAMPIHYQATAPEIEVAPVQETSHVPSSEEVPQQSFSDYVTVQGVVAGAYCIIPKNTTLIRMELLLHDSAEIITQPSSGTGVRVSEPSSVSVRSNKESIQTASASICDSTDNVIRFGDVDNVNTCAVPSKTSKNATECRYGSRNEIYPFAGHSTDDENSYVRFNTSENSTECQCDIRNKTYTFAPQSTDHVNFKNPFETPCNNTDNAMYECDINKPFETQSNTSDTISKYGCNNIKDLFATQCNTSINSTNCLCDIIENPFETQSNTSDNIPMYGCGNIKNLFEIQSSTSDNITKCQCDNIENPFETLCNNSNNGTKCQCDNIENPFESQSKTSKTCTECQCGSSRNQTCLFTSNTTNTTTECQYNIGKPFEIQSNTSDNITKCSCDNIENLFETQCNNSKNGTKCQFDKIGNPFETQSNTSYKVPTNECGNIGNPFETQSNTSKSCTECQCSTRNQTSPFTRNTTDNVTKCQCDNIGNPFETQSNTSDNVTKKGCNNIENPFETQRSNSNPCTECQCGSRNQTVPFKRSTTDNVTNCRCENIENPFETQSNTSKFCTECQCGSRNQTVPFKRSNTDNVTKCRCENIENSFETQSNTNNYDSKCQSDNIEKHFDSQCNTSEDATESQCGNSSSNTYPSTCHSADDVMRCQSEIPSTPIHRTNSELLSSENNLSTNLELRTKCVTISTPNVF